MFHFMWNEPESGTSAVLNATQAEERRLIDEAERALRLRLPSPWDLHIAFLPDKPIGPDAVLTLYAPDGSRARLIVEAKRRIDPKDVAQLVAQLHRYAASGDSILVVAPFLGPRTKELLNQADVSYLDATGNMRLRLDKPALYIETVGATSNPQKDERPLRSLKGPTAGRVVRALCDYYPPFGIRELAERSGTPASSVSRVVALLESEALLVRSTRGAVTDVQWRKVIERWAQDYALTKSNNAVTFLEPRGLDTLLRKLQRQGSSLPYVVTGSMAAAQVAPIAPPRLAAIYVSDYVTAADALGLRKASRGANVLLIEPFDSVVLERTMLHGGVVYAALSQVAADLLTGPGRSPEEAQELLRWMEGHEDDWRR